MVVTRSKNKKGKEILQDEGDADHIIWKEQQAVRAKVTKEVEEFQKDRVPPEDWDFVIRSLDDQGKKDSAGNIVKPPEQDSEGDEFYEALMSTPMSITVKQMLRLVPAFSKKLLQKLAEKEQVPELETEKNFCGDVCEVQPMDVDYRVPVVKASIGKMSCAGVLLDGGSGVNIIPESTCRSLNLLKWDPAPFQVKMADQRRVQPLGILRKLQISVGGLPFLANFVVLRLENSDCSYPMMLGRPWLRAAKVKQLWGTDTIVIKGGKKKVRLQMGAKKVIPPGARALYAEGLNMVEEIGEDAEEEFLKTNSSVVPIFEVDVTKIATQYVLQSPKGQSQDGLKDSQGVTKMGKEVLKSLQVPEAETDAAAEAVKQTEEAFQHQMERTARVAQDELQEMNLNTQEDPQTVRVSAGLDEDFKHRLRELLMEFKDIFAWKYTDMKGIDPSFCQHRINLKADAVPVIQQRYRMNPNYAKQVKEEIDKLLAVGFIYPVEEVTWLSPIVVVPKKNGKIRVCVDYRKLNAATITDPFPLPFCDTLLDAVAGHEIYSFLDGFSVTIRF